MVLTTTSIAFLSLGATSAIISGLLTYQEIGEVNRKLPEDQQVTYLFMYPGKMQKIKAEYKRLYPEGRVDLWRNVFQVAMFILMGLSAIAGGFLK